MPPSSERPLVPFRQELPHRPLAEAWEAVSRREPGVAFLDAGGDGEGSRWSVLGWRPRRTLRWPAGRPGAIEAVRAFLGPPRLARDPDAPAPYRGGFLGWIGYDVGRDVERIPCRNPPRPEVPELVLAEYETLLVEDRRERRLFLAGACDPGEGPSRHLARQQEALEAFADASGAADEAVVADGPAVVGLAPLFAREDYLRRAARVIEYVHAGDVFQANLAHRFEGRLRVPPREAYRRLRAESPAAWGCFLSLGGPDVLSISPELFLERRGGRVTTEPVKGTRPRGAAPGEDAALLLDLESSPKDRAELAMIVDLLRNDLGRVATTGTVRVEVPRGIRTHPSLHHAFARVAADLSGEVHAADLLRATMPGGSVTGAPKIRAMEILEELEDGRRGPYCGAAGWFGYDGDLALNLLIRTAVTEGDRLSFHVGGGIVADSSPEEEWEETLVKARALLRALGVAETGAETVPGTASRTASR
jgi:para-aminobenzoate synthetase component 1